MLGVVSLLFRQFESGAFPRRQRYVKTWEHLCYATKNLELCVLLPELQEKKKKGEGGGGEGKEKGKGKEDEDGEDALDWWSRYYETLKDRERNERKEEQQQLARASKKKEKRTEEETEEEKMKKKIPRLTVRSQLKRRLVRMRCNNLPFPNCL